MPVYSLPDLPFDQGALEPHLSARIVELHHGAHHAAYVNGANRALERLGDLLGEREDAVDRHGGEQRAGDGGGVDAAMVTQLERDLAFHVSGHVLHSLLWANLSPQESVPDGGLRAAIDDHLGGLDRLRRRMAATAANLQGSGWAALVWEPTGQRLQVVQLRDHQDNAPQGHAPLLVLDMWEHAYYLQYENRKNEWIDAFWRLVNWPDVASRFEAARRADLTIVR